MRPPTPTAPLLLLALAVGCVLPTACSRKPKGSGGAEPPPPLVTSKSLARRPGAPAPLLFDHLPPAALPFTSSTPAAGLAIADLNGDTRPDVFFSGGTGAHGLFLQSDPATLRYFDASPTSGLGGGTPDAPATGVAIADIDNDGHPDLFVAVDSAPDQLFLNDGNSPPAFTAAANRFGLGSAARSLLPAFADIDRDGDLDLFVLDADGAHRLLENPLVPRAAADPDNPTNAAGTSGTTFTDITAAAGISATGPANTALWWDYNRDGLPDLFIGGAPGTAHQLFMNNGDRTFIDVAPASLPGDHDQALAAAAADLDADTLPDLVAVGTASSPARPSDRLYLNSGTHRFLEAAQLAGIPGTGNALALKLGDFDSDGLTDAFVALATPGEAITPAPNRIYRNGGNLAFTDRSASWLPSNNASSAAVASADLDRDGDLDLVVANLDAPATIFRNSSPGTAHSVLVRLIGAHSHRSGAGALLQLDVPGLQPQLRELTLTTGGPSSDEPLVHFALGRALAADRLTVRWPSGHVSTVENLNADRLYTVNEPPGPPPAERTTTPAATPSRPAWFTESAPLLDYRHPENDHDDFAAQPLLPHRLSTQGPAAAVADVDGDGDDDLFLGGPAGQPGALFISNGTGGFTPKPLPALAADAACEDVGVLFFEADGDGDPDLYVVSGGTEHRYGALPLLDRLYLNDGAGNFTPAPAGSLPAFPESGGGVAAADFDRDGDLDLFVGARTTPGRYPYASGHHLLVNDGTGKFRDRIATLAPDLQYSGMATAALWSDATGDGLIDLVVAHDWGTVHVFKNINGRSLEPVAPLPDSNGFWTSLTAVDVDHDGDMDYVAGNLGLNTPYRASRESPAVLYAGDLTGDHTFDLLEALTTVDADGQATSIAPVRSADAIAAAMPKLGAGANPDADKLSAAARFRVTELATGVFLNDGSGALTFTPLPYAAQLAPVRGTASTDLDGDGHPDLLLAQNSLAAHPETGPLDSGLSLVLRGTGTGAFTPVSARDSGLVITGDTRALALLHAGGSHLPDLLVTTNRGPAHLFVANPAGTSTVGVQLTGAAGNPAAVGARVTLRLSDGVAQTAEVSAGSGYLSQHTTRLHFGLPQSAAASATLTVTWPDGARTTEKITGASGTTLSYSQPDKP